MIFVSFLWQKNKYEARRPYYIIHRYPSEGRKQEKQSKWWVHPIQMKEIKKEQCKSLHPFGPNNLTPSLSSYTVSQVAFKLQLHIDGWLIPLF